MDGGVVPLPLTDLVTMMKGWPSTVVFFSLLLMISPSWGGEVVAEGRAPLDEPMARSQALADALREAVREGAGVDLVSETQVKDFALVSDRMFSKARGYVRRYEVLSSGAEGNGFYTVRIKADVQESLSDSNDKLGFRMMAREHQAPRLSIRIDERIEQANNGTLASDWLGNSASECGLHVVEQGYSQEGMQTRRAVALGREQEAAMRRDEVVSDCDYIIEGSVVGSSAGSESFYGSKPCKKFSLGLNLKVVDAATGAVILSENAPSRDILVRRVSSDTAAAREAVRQLMEGSPKVPDSDAGWKLIRRIFSHWAAEMDLGAVYKLEFRGMDLETARQLREKLAAIRNVSSVWIRSVDPAGVSVVDCEARLQPLDLASVVEQKMPGYQLDRSEKRYLSFLKKAPASAGDEQDSFLLYAGISSCALLVLAAFAIFLKHKHKA